MIIRNLVLSGGGPSGFLTYGASKYLNKIGFWELANIKSRFNCLISSVFGLNCSNGCNLHFPSDNRTTNPATNQCNAIVQ